jgi:hypothetical protein
MRRRLALAIAVALLFVSCNDEITDKDEHESAAPAEQTAYNPDTFVINESREPVSGREFTDTWLFASGAAILSGEPFTIVIESAIAGTTTVYRDGEKYRQTQNDGFGYGDTIIVGDYVYLFNGEHDVWGYTTVDEEWIEWSRFGFTDIFVNPSLTLTATGTTAFLGREVFFEEFEEEFEGIITTTRYFLDGELLLGKQNVDDDEPMVNSVGGVVTTISINTGVPPSAFDVPDRSEMLTYQAFMDKIMSE